MKKKGVQLLRKTALVIAGLLTITSMVNGNDYQPDDSKQDTKTEVKVIEGKIIDNNTKKPVIFANVYISGTSIGTVSNSDGEFIIKIPLTRANEELSITYIGYQNMVVPINTLGSEGNTLKLKPDPMPIKEVVVRPEDPLKLLRSALMKVSENFFDKPAMLTSFYRETVKQNRSYVAVSEAIMDIYKSSYKNELTSDRVKIFKGRKSSDVKRMDTVLFKLQGGPKSSVLLDIVKNPSNLLSPAYFDFYEYEYYGIINIDDRQNYVISFDQREDVDMPLFAGKVYLDVENLAITRLDFAYSEYGLENASSELVRKKPGNMKIEVLGGNYLVKYRELNDKWYLNYVRSELKFKCKWDKKLFKSTYRTMFEMAVTDMDTENVQKFKYNETVNLSDIFVEQVSYTQNDDYWGDYNYIKPDESIESAINKLKRRKANN